ncbi:hypothetical protein B0O99DRAFT_137745 [Bisporella sp. PMI_857]|nr:hypothetical protein B0O99DRAFT_137745 [Bisporella sp. PMI_857]
MFASALRFSQVSHKAQQVIAAHRIYKQVREHAANPLFIALQTGLARISSSVIFLLLFVTRNVLNTTRLAVSSSEGTSIITIY